MADLANPPAPYVKYNQVMCEQLVAAVVALKATHAVRGSLPAAYDKSVQDVIDTYDKLMTLESPQS